MAIYRTLEIRAWNDPTFAGLSEGARLLLVYLTTGPLTCRVPGLIYLLSEKGMAAEAGLSLQRFRKVWRELADRGYVRADWDHKLVWTPWALQHAQVNNPNQVTGWADAWDELPCCPALAAIHGELCEWLAARPAQLEAFEAACPVPAHIEAAWPMVSAVSGGRSGGVPGTIQAPSGDRSATPGEIRKQEQEAGSRKQEEQLGPVGPVAVVGSSAPQVLPAAHETPARLAIVTDSPEAGASVTTDADDTHATDATVSADPGSGATNATVSAPVEVGELRGPAPAQAARATDWPAPAAPARQRTPRKPALGAPLTPEEQAVFDAWRETWGLDGTWKLTPDRREVIRKRLAEGYAVADLVDAVRGSRLDDWADRPKHIEIEKLLKGSNVPRFAQLHRKGVPAPVIPTKGYIPASAIVHEEVPEVAPDEPWIARFKQMQAENRGEIP